MPMTALIGRDVKHVASSSRCEMRSGLRALRSLAPRRALIEAWRSLVAPGFVAALRCTGAAGRLLHAVAWCAGTGMSMGSAAHLRGGA